jgi:TatA/E family protein of Tat protein translocase
MGIENPVHLIFIGIIALLVLGPKRLPELARALGHGLREFREAVSQQGEATQQASAQQAPVLPPVSQLPAAQPQQPDHAPVSGEAVLPQQAPAQQVARQPVAEAPVESEQQGAPPPG